VTPERWSAKSAAKHDAEAPIQEDEMDREAFENMLDQIPLRITMNDGRSFVVESERGIALSDLDAYVLYRSDDGRLRGIHLPYVTMAGIETNVAR